MQNINNVHISNIKSLISPVKLKEKWPMTEESSRTVIESRKAITAILSGEDKRIMAIVGPCSIHDTKAAVVYAEKLNALKKHIQSRVLVVMRTYFEKPRTTIGWKGLITDPRLDGTYDLAGGLVEARKLLLKITEMGLPCGSEMLDPIVPQYIADLISWASIGARTSESQTHREMASGLSMPIGFKNATSGDLAIAVNGIKSSRHPHSFIGIDQQGKTAIFQTTGNAASHMILRGGKGGPNYYEEVVETTEALLSGAEIKPAIVIDCSHANSGKQFDRQSRVLRSLLDQKKRNKSSIAGFMLESNLEEGSQKLPGNLDELAYGVSITDACVGWKDTEKLLIDAYEMMG